MNLETPKARHVDDLLARYVDTNEIDLAPKDADCFDFGDVMFGEDAVLKLMPGDHIAVLVEGVNVCHGIFMGKQEDGEIVLVENTGTNIRARSWKEFSREYRAAPYLYRLNYPDATQERRGIALTVASCLAQNLMGHTDCDTFATFCWTGRCCNDSFASVLANCNTIEASGERVGLDKFLPKYAGK